LHGVATSNTPRLTSQEEAEAGAEDIKRLKTSKAPRHLEAEVIEADEDEAAQDKVGPQAGPQAGTQAGPQAGAQVRPIQREDFDSLLPVMRCTDHGLHQRAASLFRRGNRRHPQRHVEWDEVVVSITISITLSKVRQVIIEAKEIVAAVAVAVNHEGARGPDRIRARTLRADDPRVAKAAHPKTKAETTKVLPDEAEDEDEEREADVSHLVNLVSKRHSSMVGALCRRAIW
jgi:hypothetical protein